MPLRRYQRQSSRRRKRSSGGGEQCGDDGAAPEPQGKVENKDGEAEQDNHSSSSSCCTSSSCEREFKMMFEDEGSAAALNAIGGGIVQSLTQDETTAAEGGGGGQQRQLPRHNSGLQQVQPTSKFNRTTSRARRKSGRRRSSAATSRRSSISSIPEDRIPSDANHIEVDRMRHLFAKRRHSSVHSECSSDLSSAASSFKHDPASLGTNNTQTFSVHKVSTALREQLHTLVDRAYSSKKLHNSNGGGSNHSSPLASRRPSATFSESDAGSVTKTNDEDSVSSCTTSSDSTTSTSGDDSSCGEGEEEGKEAGLLNLKGQEGCQRPSATEASILELVQGKSGGEVGENNEEHHEEKEQNSETNPDSTGGGSAKSADVAAGTRAAAALRLGAFFSSSSSRIMSGGGGGDEGKKNAASAMDPTSSVIDDEETLDDDTIDISEYDLKRRSSIVSDDSSSYFTDHHSGDRTGAGGSSHSHSHSQSHSHGHSQSGGSYPHQDTTTSTNSKQRAIHRVYQDDETDTRADESTTAYTHLDPPSITSGGTSYQSFTSSQKRGRWNRLKQTYNRGSESQTHSKTEDDFSLEWSYHDDTETEVTEEGRRERERLHHAHAHAHAHVHRDQQMHGDETVDDGTLTTKSSRRKHPFFKQTSPLNLVRNSNRSSKHHSSSYKKKAMAHHHLSSSEDEDPDEEHFDPGAGEFDLEIQSNAYESRGASTLSSWSKWEPWAEENRCLCCQFVCRNRFMRCLLLMTILAVVIPTTVVLLRPTEDQTADIFGADGDMVDGGDGVAQSEAKGTQGSSPTQRDPKYNTTGSNTNNPSAGMDSTDVADKKQDESHLYGHASIYQEEFLQEYSGDVMALLTQVTSEQILNDESTPQNKAMRWLMGDDALGFYLREGADASQTKLFDGTVVVTAVLERYAMATLHFATCAVIAAMDRTGSSLLGNNLTDATDELMYVRAAPGSEDNWKHSTNWLSRFHLCDWFGVECDSALVAPGNANLGRIVTGINLMGNNIRGEIPNEISILTNLVKINLDNNFLQGPIPGAIGKLQHLSELCLAGNKISGGIPEELKSLSNIQQIDLSNNHLSGQFPKWLGILRNLRDLRLTNNNLGGSLVTMDLSTSSIAETMPPPLEILLLDNNFLKGPVPASLGLMTDLVVLKLSDNAFTGAVPTELCRCTKLMELDLSYNKLSGRLPQDMGKLINLENLVLSSNAFRGNVADALPPLPGLIQVRLDRNSLSGKIPDWIGRFSTLTKLHLHNNMLGGSVPTQLGSLSNLQELSVEENGLVGEMPSGVCALNLRLLSADCKGANPEVTCRCCTECYPSY